MGLIREIQNMTYTIDRKTRERQQRDRLKALETNYKNELKTNFQACFYRYFEKYETLEAQRKILENKNKILYDIENIINNITYTDSKGKAYYTYRNKFDIITDLNAIYWQELNKVKREYIQLDKASENTTKEHNQQMLDKLYKLIVENLENNIDILPSACEVLQKHDNIIMLAEEVANNYEDRCFLIENYHKAFTKAKRLFAGDIQQQIRIQRENARQQRERTKREFIDKKYRSVWFNIFLRDINKRL